MLWQATWCAPRGLMTAAFTVILMLSHGGIGSAEASSCPRTKEDCKWPPCVWDPDRNNPEIGRCVDFNSDNTAAIKLGAYGAIVNDIQVGLVKNGAKVEVDKKYGPSTKAAVEAFQQQNGLKMTGEVDAATMKKLLER